ncbi:MAG: sensor histidine kinase [Methylococcaceae bacterium]|nr:MAG: sensor histidine kinase [Methylococcaceae bacterium]
MRKPLSLRMQLLLRLTLPLTFVVILDTAVSYYVALHYSNVAYDRWLLDSVRSLAQEVKAQRDGVSFDLPPTAVEMFRWDDMDKTFFKVESTRVGFLAGDSAVPNPPDLALLKTEPYYFDSEVQGTKVRVVSMLMAPTATSEEVLVEVAETVNKRYSMINDILLAVVVPQLLLVLVTGFHIWTGINRGLRPLHNLTREIAQRSPRDLTPIHDALVPLEVLSLTHTINNLLNRLASAMVAQQRFIENAAHQLRTPLAGLKVQAERALRIDDLPAMRPALTSIKSSADRVAHLSSQLLVLARSENAEGHRLLQPVNLQVLAKECCIEWVPRALEKDIELDFDAPQAPIPVAGDATLLKEMLNNLLDNAVRYGKPDGRITVQLLSGVRPALIVEDDGQGIPSAELDKVFERFYRIPGSQGDGCGLGLSIVKEIADLHAARVGLSSAGVGQGLRVEVVF